VPHNFEFSEKNERNLIERIYFCLREPEKLERRDGKVLPCCVHAMLQKKEDLSAKASALVVLYVLFVSDHAEVRSITNISSLSVFAGARAISDQRQPHDLFRWFSLLCTTPPVQTDVQPFIYRAVLYIPLSFYFFFGACCPPPLLVFGKRADFPDCFICAWDFGTFPFTSLDILIPDHTPVPCMESVAPTAYAIPSAAVLMDQKIGMVCVLLELCLSEDV